MHMALFPVHWPRSYLVLWTSPQPVLRPYSHQTACLISNEVPASCFQQLADDVAMVQVIRPMYSNPPRHGAAIVTAILSDPELYSQWKVSIFGVQHCPFVCPCLRHCAISHMKFVAEESALSIDTAIAR
jgi:hypothetical protein